MMSITAKFFDRYEGIPHPVSQIYTTVAQHKEWLSRTPEAIGCTSQWKHSCFAGMLGKKRTSLNKVLQYATLFFSH